MYLLQYHGGGLTGELQTNDMWLHLEIERILGDIEALEFNRQALLHDKIPTISRQAILDMYFTMWEKDIDHTKSIEWTKRSGLSVPLDGSEDIGPPVGRFPAPARLFYFGARYEGGAPATVPNIIYSMYIICTSTIYYTR